MKKLLLFLCGIIFSGSVAFSQSDTIIIVQITANVNGQALSFGERICSGASVTFDQTSFGTGNCAPISGYQWEFPGGSPASSTDPNPTVTYNIPGVYDVTLTVTGGSCSRTRSRNGLISVADYSSIAVTTVKEDFEYFAFPPLGWRITGPWELGTRGIDRDTIYHPNLVPEEGNVFFGTMPDNFRDTIVWIGSNRSASCVVYKGEAVDPQFNRRTFAPVVGAQSLFPPVMDTRAMTGGVLVKADVAYRGTIDGPVTIYGAFEIRAREACAVGVASDLLGRWDAFTLPELATAPPGNINPASQDSAFKPYFIPEQDVVEWQHLQAALLDVRDYDFVEFELRFNSQGGNNLWVDNVELAEIKCPFGIAIEPVPSLEIWPYGPPPAWNCSEEPPISYNNLSLVPGDPNAVKYTWIYDAVLDQDLYSTTTNIRFLPNPNNPNDVDQPTSSNRNGEATFNRPLSAPVPVVVNGYPNDTIINLVVRRTAELLVGFDANGDSIFAEFDLHPEFGVLGTREPDLVSDHAYAIMTADLVYASIPKSRYSETTIEVPARAGDSVLILPPNNEFVILNAGDKICRVKKQYLTVMSLEADDPTCPGSDTAFTQVNVTPWASCIADLDEDFEQGLRIGNIDEDDDWVHRSGTGGYAWPTPPGLPQGWFPSAQWVTSCFTGENKFVQARDGSTTQAIVAANYATAICTPFPAEETWLISPKIDLSLTDAKHYLLEFDLSFAPQEGWTSTPNNALEIRVIRGCDGADNPGGGRPFYQKASFDTAGPSLHTRSFYNPANFPWHVPEKNEWITEQMAIDNFQENYIDQEDSVIRFKFVNKGATVTGGMVWIDNVRTRGYNHDGIAEFRANRREQCVDQPIRLHSSSYGLGGANVIGYSWEISPGSAGNGFPGVGTATFDPDSLSQVAYISIDAVGTYDVTHTIFTELGGENDTISVTYKDYLTIIDLVPTHVELEVDFEDAALPPVEWDIEGVGWEIFNVAATPESDNPGGYGRSGTSAFNTNDNAGTTASFVSPILDTEQYPKHMELTFDMAHRRDLNDNNNTDEFIVSYTSCEGNEIVWRPIGNNISQSQAPNIANYDDPQGKEWRTRRIYLPNVSDLGNIFWNIGLRQSGDNQLYLDNIRVRKVNDVVAEFRPQTGTDVINKVESVLACQGTPYTMASTSKIIFNNDFPSYEWIFEGDPTVVPVNPDNSVVNVTWDTPGRYDVTLIVTSGLPDGDKDTLTIENYVRVQPRADGPEQIIDDFEGNGTSDKSGFSFRGWEIDDRGWYSTLENGVLQQGVSNQGNRGTSFGSAAINNFNENYEGEKTLLKSETINTENTDWVQVDYDWAFSYFDCNNCERDGFEVLYTTECGLTDDAVLQSVYSAGERDFVDVPNYAIFTPNPDQWQSTRDRDPQNGNFINVIDIPAINVVFRAEPGAGPGFNNVGHNMMYVDNVNIRPVNGVVAAFELKEEQNCSAEPNFVQFFDASYVPARSIGETITSWSWEFPGAAEGYETSSEQNPAVIYDEPGWKDVKLTVTTQNYTDEQVFERAVFIQPFLSDEFGVEQNFETTKEDFLKFSGWDIRPKAKVESTDADDLLDVWTIKSPGGYRSSTSSIAMNSALAGSEISDLVSPILKTRYVDERGQDQYMTNFRISFDYAYTYRLIDGLAAFDSLYIEFTTDCGYTWERAWGNGGTGLATRAPLDESVFAAAGERRVFDDPKEGDWQSEELEFLFFNLDREDDPRGPFGPESIQFRFRAVAQGGNQLFLDNIVIELFEFQEPKANFISELSPNDTIFKNATIRFFDESLGTPFNWAWSFPRAEPSISNLRNPEITYLETGLYDVSLTVSNVIGTNALTKKQFVTVIPYDGSTDSLDNRPVDYETKLPELQENISPADEGRYVGYFSGHNSRFTLQVAEYFSGFHPYNELREADFAFGIANYISPTNSKIKIKVWDSDGLDPLTGLPNGSPGTEIYPGIETNFQGTDEVLIADLANIIDTFTLEEIVEQQRYYKHEFPSSGKTVVVDRDFYLGFELSYNPKDTVVIITSPLTSPNLTNEVTRRLSYSGWTRRRESPGAEVPVDPYWDDYNSIWARETTIDGGNLFEQAVGENVGGLTNWIFPVLGANYSTVASIDEDEVTQDDFNVTVFPNPTDGILNIYSPDALVSAYAVFDVLGKQVLNSTEQESLERVDLGQLNSGMYILVIETEKGKVSKKISVRH